MAAPSVTPVALWDPVVRLTHWSVAIVVLSNAVLTEGGSSLHVWAGWVGLGLLALRFLWGFLSPGEAHFSAFPPDPRAAFAHLAGLLSGKVREHPSHNPAGALMAYALWATLIVLSATGLIITKGQTPMQMDDVRATVAEGDWSVLVKDGKASDTDSGLAEVAEEMHEIAGNLILALVLLHVAGVILESRMLRRNLVPPMLFGRRK